MGPIAMQDADALVTAEQVLADPRYRSCEVWDGIAVVKEPSGGWAPYVTMRLARRLVEHVETRGLGWVGGPDVGFLLRRSPDRVLSPDLAFVRGNRMAAPPARGFAEVVPDFVVEVRSPEQSERELLQRGLLWTSHGVAVVWLVEPDGSRIVALHPGAPARTFGPGDTVRANPVLPDFAVAIDDLRPSRPPA